MAVSFMQSASANRDHAVVDRRWEALSFTGGIAFLTGFAVFASGFKNLRPQIGGLYLHPCLVLLLVAAPFVIYGHVERFPKRILVFLSIFTAMYCFSVFGSNVSWGEIAKTLSAALMIVITALLIRSRTDFVAGVLGYVSGIGLLAMRGLQSEEITGYGINPIDVANKNSFSIYALPAILLAGSVLLYMRRLSWMVRALLAIFGLVSMVSILMSGNRSGWLGVAVIGVLFINERKLAGTLLVITLSGAAAYWITNYGDTKIIEQRVKDTREGRTADNLRRELFQAAFGIALENPVLGVSPRQLPFELARRLEGHERLNYVDPHNVFGNVAGGSGLICFAALIGTGWAMWRWPFPPNKAKQPISFGYRAAIRTIHSMLILWVVRGMFTRELLYNPGTCIGLGLAIGWCMLEESLLQKSQLQSPLATSSR